jgi:hypothetical protein
LHSLTFDTGRSQRKHMSLVFLSLERGKKLHLFPCAINDDVEVNCFEEYWGGISVTPGLLFLIFTRKYYKSKNIFITDIFKNRIMEGKRSKSRNKFINEKKLSHPYPQIGKG